MKVSHISELVDVPDGVKVELSNGIVRVSGPKGQLTKNFARTGVKVSLTADGKVKIEAWDANRRLKAMVGTVAAQIRNMILGVTKGFRYELKVAYAHFPVSVKVQGDTVLIENFLGERAPRKAKIIGDVKVSVAGDTVIVEGADKEQVAQTAANIHLATHIKDLDPRVFMDGIYVVSKGAMESG